jgi:hypothetical protein
MPGFIDEQIKAYYVRRLYAFGIILTVGAIILFVAIGIANLDSAQRPQLAQAVQQYQQPVGQPRDERRVLRNAAVRIRMGHHW